MTDIPVEIKCWLVPESRIVRIHIDTSDLPVRYTHGAPFNVPKLVLTVNDEEADAINAEGKWTPI